MGGGVEQPEGLTIGNGGGCELSLADGAAAADRFKDDDGCQLQLLQDGGCGGVVESSGGAGGFGSTGR